MLPFHNSINQKPLRSKIGTASVKEEKNQYLNQSSQNLNSTVEENENIDILCINCQKMINAKDIDTHSLHCTEVEKNIMELSSMDDMKQIAFQIGTLISALDSHYQTLIFNTKQYKFSQEKKRNWYNVNK